MADKDKIRLMVDLAIYEKQRENDVFRINSFYKSDYIFWNTLQACMRYTLMFLICVVLYIVLNATAFFSDINLYGIYPVLGRVGRYFIIGFIIYLVIAVIVYSLRYSKAKKGMYFYASKLKRLARKYHYIDASSVK